MYSVIQFLRLPWYSLSHSESLRHWTSSQDFKKNNSCQGFKRIILCEMGSCWERTLTHWGRVTHICINKLTIIGSDNGLSPGRRQAIIWTNAGLMLIGPLETNFSEISIEILTFSFKKTRLKVSSAKRRPFCLGLNVLTKIFNLKFQAYEHIPLPALDHMLLLPGKQLGLYFLHWIASLQVTTA